MKTVVWNIETGMQGADWDGEIEVEDDATEEEIEGLVREEVFNIVSYGWSFKDEPAPPSDRMSASSTPATLEK